MRRSHRVNGAEQLLEFITPAGIIDQAVNGQIHFFLSRGFCRILQHEFFDKLGFPAFQQKGDALYYATYFASLTFNPFVAYPVIAVYFILLTVTVIATFGLIGRRLNRHLPQSSRPRFRLRPQIIR